MTHRSKSTLFLIEQIIVIAVFAICAAACVRILTAAYFTANDTQATSHAVLRAESAAEVFKATSGDVDAIASVLGGTSGTAADGVAGVAVYYDSSWQISNEGNASYHLGLAIYPPQNPNDAHLLNGEIWVVKITGEELVSFPVATRSG